LDKISKIAKIVLPIYWAFLTYMLLKPGIENKEYSWLFFPGFDKMVHFLIFGFLAFLFSLSLPKLNRFFFIGIILGYAILTEVLQEEMHLGRSMEALDVVADLLGAFSGFYFSKWLIQKING